MPIKDEIRNLFRSFGYDICRYPPTSHPLGRIKKMFASYGIDTVLDVGANTGQFAQQLREYVGYKKRIMSFEPLSSAFELLKANAKGDPKWETFNFALGDEEAKQEINIAGNSYSSSLLDMLPSHERSAPESKYIGREVVEVKTLDSIFDNLCKPNNSIYLKIDTRGFESKVIKGAKKALAHIGTVQLEMSLIPLYKDELLFNEMCIFMSEQGFNLVTIEEEYSDPVSGQLLQVNGTFHRSAYVIT